MGHETEVGEETLSSFLASLACNNVESNWIGYNLVIVISSQSLYAPPVLAGHFHITVLRKKFSGRIIRKKKHDTSDYKWGYNSRLKKYMNILIIRIWRKGAFFKFSCSKSIAFALKSEMGKNSASVINAIIKKKITQQLPSSFVRVRTRPGSYMINLAVSLEWESPARPSPFGIYFRSQTRFSRREWL